MRTALSASRGDLAPDAVPIDGEFAVLSGSANPELARAIAHELHVSPAAAAADRFPDGETSVQLLQPVRGKTVFIIQPTAPPVRTLIEAGARAPLFIATTHALLLTGSKAKLTTGAIAKVFVTDTVKPAEPAWPDLHVVSVARLLADAIRRVTSHGSMTDSYEP